LTLPDFGNEKLSIATILLEVVGVVQDIFLSTRCAQGMMSRSEWVR
jgi:hypothetical protein